MKKLSLFLFIIVLLISSCSKDHNDSNAITKENLAGSYSLVSAKANIFSQEVDLTATSPLLPVAVISACQKDDIITLKTDNTFTWQDAGQTCTPNGSSSGTWSLSNNKIDINGVAFVSGTTSISGTIDKFDGKSLQLKDTVNISSLQVPITLLFSKQ